MAALPEVLTAGSMQLRCWSPSLAEAMLIAIEESYPELKQWMPWAQEMPTVDGLRGVLRQGELDFHAGKGWEYTIFGADSDDVMGAAGLHRTDEPAGLRSATGCVRIRPAEVSPHWPLKPLSVPHQPTWAG